jgi:glutamyl-Q tRNA(Asp) synthetase
VNVVKSNTATATTATDKPAAYVGRFAPSPTGDLHLGSLLTAVASYLDARANRGRWLLRIEDLDRDREVKDAEPRILRALESFGLLWDGPVVRQTSRAQLYAGALERLKASNLLFACRCSRRQLRDEQHYPGTCRHSEPPAFTPTAMRFKVDSVRIDFDDSIQGRISQDPANSSGDFIVKRRDAVIAYALAVVVDDAAQGVTHIVRGADLLDCTAGQILLQRALGLPQPVYAHVPLLMEPAGGKLSKTRRSPALAPDGLAAQLCSIAELLGMDPPEELKRQEVPRFWEWAVENWSLQKVPKLREVPLI